MWGKAAPSLTSGYCADTNCSECRESWYDDFPNDKEYRCKCDGIYKFKDKCTEEDKQIQDTNLCMTGDNQFCHWSYAINDPD